MRKLYFETLTDAERRSSRGTVLKEKPGPVGTCASAQDPFICTGDAGYMIYQMLSECLGDSPAFQIQKFGQKKATCRDDLAFRRLFEKVSG